MNIKPMGDRLLIERDALSDKTDSGIILNTDKDDRVTRTGIIKARGHRADKELAVGERVLFNKYAGACYKDDLFILKQDEILAIV